MKINKVKETIKILETLPSRSHAEPGKPFLIYGAEIDFLDFLRGLE